MVTYGVYEGQVYCKSDENFEVDLPCSEDTTIDGVKLSTFFNFLRELTQEELAKDSLYLDINDNLQDIEEDIEATRTNAYIESQVMSRDSELIKVINEAIKSWEVKNT